LEKIRQNPPKGIILSGGPVSVYEDQAPVCDKKIFKLGIPILGICYGAQLITQVSRGKVIKTSQAEYGRVNVILNKQEDIFYEFPDSATCWMSHQDLVENIPPNFEVIARSENTKVVAMANKEKKIYGVQFHPEVSHTPLGKKLLENFLCRICQCQPSWNLESFIQQSIKDIKEKIGKGKVVAGVSGGIDSIVAAVLTHKAIGDQLHCIFINNGLLRKGEAEEVQKRFKNNYKIDLIYVDTSKRFLKRLKNVSDPETKRKIIGEEFIRVFEEKAKDIGEVEYLLQGTLYPDVIESISL
jgi:GMP synthase (glutamine-hydrolysing)